MRSLRQRLSMGVVALTLGGCKRAPPAPSAVDASPIVDAAPEDARVDAPSDASARDASAPPRTTAYRGTIGGAKVFVRLAVAGTVVTGEYFYGSQKKYIDLKGTADGAHLTLDETVHGQVTGHVDATLGDGTAAGTWSDPSGKKPLPLRLDAARAKPDAPVELATESLKFERKARSGQALGDPTCSVDAAWVRVVGLESKAVEDAMNALLVRSDLPSAGACDEAFAELQSAEVTYNADGVLGVRYAMTSDAGGAHPQYAKRDLVLDVATGVELTLESCLTSSGADRLQARLAAVVKTQEDEGRRQYLTDAIAVAPLAFVVSRAGIEIDVFNQTPHYDKGAANGLFVFSWKELQPWLNGCKLAAIARQAHP